MSKVTLYKSDISDKVIDDEKQRAQIKVTYPGDKRRAVRVVDLTAQEADALLGTFGHTVNAPGRKPKETGEEPGSTTAPSG